MSGEAERVFLLAGNGSYSNRGCEAIVRGTASILRSEFGSCRFFSAYFRERGCDDASEESDDAIVHLPMRAADRFSRPWFRRRVARIIPIVGTSPRRYRCLEPAIGECEAALMLGGDNYNLEEARPDDHFALNRLVRRLGKPVVLWGASVGPFSRDPEYERWAAGELRQVSLICARERVTLEYLRSIGVEDNVRLVADPAFLLEATPAGLPDEIEEALSGDCIGLNLSPLIGRRRWGRDVRAWLLHATEVVRSIVSVVPYPVVLIPHVVSASGRLTVRADDLFLRRVVELAGADPARLLLLGPTYNASQTKWIISRLRAFVGARTHSTIAALSSQVATICIAYSTKAYGVARDIYGHDGWVVHIRDLDGADLADRLSRLLEDESAIRRQIGEALPVMRQRAALAGRHLREILK